jgi:hypothetical protein
MTSGILLFGFAYFLLGVPKSRQNRKIETVGKDMSLT